MDESHKDIRTIKSMARINILNLGLVKRAQNRGSQKTSFKTLKINQSQVKVRRYIRLNQVAG